MRPYLPTFSTCRRATIMLAGLLMPIAAPALTCTSIGITANVVESCSVRTSPPAPAPRLTIACATVFAYRIGTNGDDPASHQIAINHVECTLPARSTSLDLSVLHLPSRGNHSCAEIIAMTPDSPPDAARANPLLVLNL